MEKTPVWKIEWNDEMSVGIPEVDEGRKRFIGLVNNLNRSIIDRADQAVIRQNIQLLIDDAIQDFSLEERLFKKWHYPVAEEHAQIHATILKGLQDIMGSISSDALGAELIEANLKIKAILINHLLVEDVKYSASQRDYLRATSIAGSD
jgi:hemerythrin